jgi:ribosomal protein S18 acetylase RimI-like enzyme
VSYAIRRFRREDADEIARLCRAEGWESWDDPEDVASALTGGGVTTLVAAEGDRVVGAIEVIGDGHINWLIAMLLVAPGKRGRGIGTGLVEAAFAETGARRLDVLTEDEGPRFYRRLPHRELLGFRLYRPS